MKIVFAFILLSLGAYAETPVLCGPRTLGQSCYVGNGQKEIVGQCVWLENHYVPSCLITDCAEQMNKTLGVKCQKSESEVGICKWPRGFVVPQCE